ncbi:MAG: hypothetical protein ACLUTA_04630 [Blautia wexlerae]
MLNEETYRITARESDSKVFTYDVETEQIQFLNDKYQSLGAESVRTQRTGSASENQGDQSGNLFCAQEYICQADSAEALHSQKAKVWAGGRMRYLQIKTTNLYGMNRESVPYGRQYFEDITDMENDMLKLQKEARTDLLDRCHEQGSGHIRHQPDACAGTSSGM